MKPSAFRSFRSSHFATGSAIFLCFSANQLQAQIEWSTAAGSAWLDTANWTGAVVPGTTDIAQFSANPTSGTTGVGINMNGTTNNGANHQAVGAIEVTNLRNNLNLLVGNSSTTIGGTLTLNGATVNSVSNTVLRNNGGGTTTLTLQNTQGSGNKTMAVVFDNGAPVVNAAGAITISSILTSANGFTKTGAGTFIVSGSANSIGAIAINEGRLQLGNAGAFGGAGSVTVASGGELRFQSGGTLTTTRALTISGTGVSGVGAITAGGSTVVNLDGGITLSADSTIKGDGGCSFNTIVGSDLSGTNTNLTVNLDSGVVSTFSGNLSLGSGGMTKGGGSTLNLNGTTSYTGATLVNGGVLAIGGAGGSILTTSDITTVGGTLNLNNTAGNADRVTNSQAVNLSYGGGLSLTGNAGADTSETVGVINLTGSGTLSVTSATDRITTLAADTLNRVSLKATALVRGTSLDQAAASNVARITLADGGASLGMVGTNTLNGAGIADATQAVRIIPWMLGDATPAGTGSGFVTYDAALGLRVLTAAQTVELTAPYVTAANPDNATVSAGLTLDNAGSGITVNSLLFKTAAAALDSAAAQPLTINSGALATTANVATTIGSGFSSIVLGNGEGVITVPLNTLAVNAPIHVTSGGGITKTGGGGTLALTAANTYTGKTTHNGGTISFNTIADVGAGASALGAPTTVENGTLDWFGGNFTYTGAGSSSNRAINLQLASSTANVSLFNTGTGMLTLSGGITGTGSLVVRGTGADVTLAGVLAHNGGLSHTESRTLVLTNPNNSFPGAFTNNSGTVSFDTIADSGINCAIGAGNIINLGQNGFNNTGRIQFTGASGGSSNRPINVFGNGATTNGGVIENTVAGQTLTLSGDITAMSGTAPSLVFTGAGDGLVTGNISGSGLTVAKSGSGTWTLIGSNTYTGTTSVTEGLLQFNSIPQNLSALVLGGGPAGTTATIGIPADTVVLNGNVTYSATNNPNGAVIAAGTLNFGSATRTFTVGNSTAAASDLTINSIITGTGGLTKVGTGTLTLPNANAFTGNVQITGIANLANTLRIEHAEALGPVGTAKTVTLTGSNRQTSILELANNITVDDTKTINTSGKSYLAQEDSNVGSPVFLRSASGNNTWLGNILINSGGGSYYIESAAGSSLTIGAPASTSTMQQSVDASTRAFQFIGGGTITLNSRLVPNGTFLTGLNKLGSGLLVIPRTDNDFTSNPNLAAGLVEVESIANSTVASSLGTGTGINLGATLRHVGSASSSSGRALQFIGTSPTLESSGTGTLSLTSGTAVTYNNGAGSTAAPFDSGATTLTLNDVWSLMPGMGISGRGIDAGTLITAVDYDARQVTLSKPTTLTTLGGRALPLSVAGVIGDTFLTLTPANASLPNLFVGMNVSRTGIAPNTTITAINTTTGVISISNALTGAISTTNSNVNFNSNSMTVSGGNAVPRTFTLGGTNTGDNIFAPPLVNPSAAALSVVKKDAGKWILTGNSSYNGSTSVNQGTLLVNGTHSGVSTFTVASGATLGGTGSIASSVTVNGTLAPGASIEDLATGSLTFGNNSTLAIEINTALGTADQVIVTGDVDTGGNTVNLTLTDLGGNATLALGTKLTLVDYSGVWDDTDIVHFNAAPVPNGSKITLGANTFIVDYSDGTAMTLTAASAGGSPFEDWVSNPAFGLAVADQDPADDPDKDGRDNLLEFALDGNPADPANNGKMMVRTDDSGDAGTARDLSLTLAVRNGATLGSGPGGSVTLTVDGIVYAISGSANLQTWDKAVGEVTPAFTLIPAPSTGWTARTFQVSDSNTLPDKRFIRVGVSQ
jgi:autotransporter-associated beta strand protein